VHDITADSIHIARLEGRVEALEGVIRRQADQIKDLANKLDEVLNTLHEAKGGWRALMWLGGVSATVGGFVAWAANHFTFR
jgi:hypothetical protein